MDRENYEITFKEFNRSGSVKLSRIIGVHKEDTRFTGFKKKESRIKYCKVYGGEPDEGRLVGESTFEYIAYDEGSGLRVQIHKDEEGNVTKKDKWYTTGDKLQGDEIFPKRQELWPRPFQLEGHDRNLDYIRFEVNNGEILLLNELEVTYFKHNDSVVLRVEANSGKTYNFTFADGPNNSTRLITVPRGK
ncbi:MAG: hypothetical protein U9O94_09605 [Nanoarchaeota archaeon]|nr:hypothetical protein [Nanoarchaeota archaeon]